jgi:hypothetical protein
MFDLGIWSASLRGTKPLSISRTALHVWNCFVPRNDVVEEKDGFERKTGFEPAAFSLGN